MLVSCGKQSSTENVLETTIQDKTGKVILYYFHGKQRCKMCVAIQQIAHEVIAKNYADNQLVKLIEVDFTMDSKKALANKYEIAWSSLIVVYEEKFVNLTDEAFAKALSDPAGLSTLVINTINQYLSDLEDRKAKM